MKPFEHNCDTSDNVKHRQVRKQENVESIETWKQARVILSDGSVWESKKDMNSSVFEHRRPTS